MSSRPLRIGDQIHGFAGGLFGRDHYTCVTVEHVAPDYAVCRGTHDLCRMHVAMVRGVGDLKFAQGQRDNPDPQHCTAFEGCRQDEYDDD